MTVPRLYARIVSEPRRTRANIAPKPPTARTPVDSCDTLLCPSIDTTPQTPSRPTDRDANEPPNATPQPASTQVDRNPQVTAITPL
jgi:hypothetical protein